MVDLLYLSDIPERDWYNHSMKKFLYFAVFISGLTTLAVEFSTSRLLGNYFGTSNLVWASIIGLILIFLTAGYFIGGRWADKSPHPKTFFLILLWAGFLIGIVPLVSRPILQFASKSFENLLIGPLVGSFFGVLILLSVPVTLMGTASPFAIRLAITEPEKAGKISGKVYAISTLGSFLGTFLPTLISIPLIGTYRTFLTFSLLLIITALIGLWMHEGYKRALFFIWMPLAIILLMIFGLKGADKQNTGLVFETESAYNYIQVQKSGEFTLLRLNEGQGYHSVYHPTQILTGGPWEQVLAAPFFNDPPYLPDNVKSMAIVGLAAGTTARQAAIAFPGISIDGFEIDPKIITIAQMYFDMTYPNLHIFVQDGRTGLRSSQSQYQIISVDAYRPPYIPAHMTTLEFFEIVHQHLTEDGVLVINVGRSPSNRDLLNALYDTIACVFPSVFIMDVPDSMNSIIYATKISASWENLQSNLQIMQEKNRLNPLVEYAIVTALHNRRDGPISDFSLVFTDDKAPVEWLTNQMVVSFILSEEIENLK